MEKKSNISEGTVEFELKNGNKLLGSNIDGNPMIPKIKVFNRDFVEESVFPIQRDNMRPIYIIGEESAEKQKQIDELNAKKAEITRQLSAKTSEYESVEREEERFAADQGRLIKMAPGLSGILPYSNYNQASFRAKAETLIQYGNTEDLLLTDDAYEVLRKVSVADKKSTIFNDCSYIPRQCSPDKCSRETSANFDRGGVFG